MTPDRVIQMNMEIAIISAHICLMFPPETVEVQVRPVTPGVAGLQGSGTELELMTLVLDSSTMNEFCCFAVPL